VEELSWPNHSYQFKLLLVDSLGNTLRAEDSWGLPQLVDTESKSELVKERWRRWFSG
jgi:hypothetical protein